MASLDGEFWRVLSGALVGLPVLPSILSSHFCLLGYNRVFNETLCFRVLVRHIDGLGKYFLYAHIPA